MFDSNLTDGARSGHVASQIRSPRRGRLGLALSACIVVAAGLAHAGMSAATASAEAAPLAQGGLVGDATAKVFLRNSTVRVGEEAQLFIEVDGADRAEVLAPPTAKGLRFEAVSGPARRESIVIGLGGRQQRTVRLTFASTARPTSVGTYEIAPLRLRIDGREVTAPTEPLILKVVEDMDASSLLTFKREGPPAHVYEGEPYDVDMRFGFDASLRVASVELSLPWWNGLDGVIELNQPSGSGSNQHGVFVNRGRRQQAADYVGQVEINGQPFHQLSLRRRYIASRPGKLTYGQAVFEFSQLLRAGSPFEAATTREFYATMPAFELEVRAVPEAGRPFEWTGAVGSLSAERGVDRRDVDVGASIKLQVSWTGRGNLEFFDAPDLGRTAGFEGFRVLGTEDQRDPDRRRVTYDIVPLRPGEQSIPAVPLWVFDTEKETFVLLETEPVPVRVRKVAGAEDPFADLGVEVEAAPLDLVDIDPRPRAGADLGGPSGGVVLGTLATLLVMWPFARRALRRGVDPDSRDARRRRGAWRTLQRELSRAPSGANGAQSISTALSNYLAARTSESPEAWLGRDPRAWRATLAQRGAAGLPSEEACAELARLIEDLDRARFGPDGAGGVVDPSRVLAVARSLRGGVL